MYTLAVRRDFVAQHALVGGDWGAANQPHSHHYVLELQMDGELLDQHGFLVDIVEVEKALTGLVARYRDRLLNSLPEFAGLNPSLETFSRILCVSLDKTLMMEDSAAIQVVLWEKDTAWASYRLERQV